jgi:predicted phage terminase large subunit-like protein
MPAKTNGAKTAMSIDNVIFPNDTTLDAILRSEFYSFVQAIFPIVSGGETFWPNWHIEAIAYALTRVMRGEIKRLIINVPPRSLKSITASVAFPAFLLGHDPTYKIICVSYAEALARKHAGDTRALMRSPLYRRLFPGTRISPRKDTELEFMTTKGGFRLAVSVGGTLTGRGGRLAILDDPMKPQDAYSETAREGSKQWYAHTLLSRLDNKADDAIIVVMQRLHVDDLVGHLLEQDGWTLLKLPAIAPSYEATLIGPDQWYARLEDDELHPRREPRRVLDELRREMGSADFSAQYLQEPVPPGGNMIKWSWFPVYDTPPQWKPGDSVIVSIDTAMTTSELADFSAAVVLHIHGDSAYVLDVVCQRLDYPDLRRKVIELHRHWRCMPARYCLLIEDKGSGTSLIQDLRSEQIHAIGIKPKLEKILRMHRHTARIEAGAVFVPRQAPWLDKFRAELLAFPLGRHDDRVDALSQALEYAFNRPRAFTTPIRGHY